MDDPTGFAVYFVGGLIFTILGLCSLIFADKRYWGIYCLVLLMGFFFLVIALKEDSPNNTKKSEDGK